MTFVVGARITEMPQRRSMVLIIDRKKGFHPQLKCINYDQRNKLHFTSLNLISLIIQEFLCGQKQGKNKSSSDKLIGGKQSELYAGTSLDPWQGRNCHGSHSDCHGSDFQSHD